MNQIDVSIIIVNWNTKKLLHDCLASVYATIKNVHFEVIVIDNASTDGSVEMVQSDFAEVKLIANTENRGFASANNQGMDFAIGRYILLLNSDTVVLTEAIDNVVAFGDLHEEAAVVGCRVLNPDMTLQPTCFMFPSLLNMLFSSSYLYKLFPKNKFFGRERMTWWHRDDQRQVDVVTGCFMLARRSAIEQVGLLDERFFMYCEETDWCYRFKQAGWKVLFTPGAQIIHLGGQSSARVRVEMLIQLRMSVLQFIRKHYGWLQHKVACLLVISFFVVRVPVWLPVSIFGIRRRKLAIAKTIAYIKGIGRVFLNLWPMSVQRESI